MQASRTLLVAAYALLALAGYGLALLPGDPDVGTPNWKGLVVGVVLLWLVARRSAVAWALVFVMTAWAVLALGFMGMSLNLGSAGIVVVFCVQLLLLLLPPLRPWTSARRGAPRSAH